MAQKKSPKEKGAASLVTQAVPKWADKMFIIRQTASPVYWLPGSPSGPNPFWRSQQNGYLTVWLIDKKRKQIENPSMQSDWMKHKQPNQ